MRRARRDSHRPPATQAFWQTFSLAHVLPVHLLLLLALPRGLVAGGDPRLLMHLKMGVAAALVALALTAVIRHWRSSQAPGIFGLAAAVMPLPLYILAFPGHWPLSLTGILLCLAHARSLMRGGKPAPAEPIRRRRGAAPSTGERPLLDSDAAQNALVFSCATSLLAILLFEGYRLPALTAGMVGEALVAGLILFGTGFSLVVTFFRRPLTWRRLLAMPQLLFYLALLCAAVPPWREAALPVLAFRQLVVGAEAAWRHQGGQAIWRFLTERPAHLLVHSFALAIALGTLLLTLPAAAVSGEGLEALDALFTATSAVCVTGLTVIDTGTAFSGFGKLVILAMIQAGGLGIMTISTFVALLMGQNLGLRGEFAIGEMMGERRSRSALRLVRFIVLSTMVAETLGALVLTGSFLRQGRPLATAAGLGVFHSVSAFCNAGFSTFGDNLAGSANARPAILLPVSLLIILGGLGFSVIYAVFRRLRHAEPLSLHARIVLAMTAALLGGGAIFFWLLERNHGLRATTLPLSWLHAWFQSVTTRTAGFNSVDITALSPITQITMILLMYIGAAPGSTAGGIKVTTAAVLLLLVRSLVRRETGLVAGGRKITLATVQQAAGLLVLSLAVITGAWLLLLWTERQPALPLLFEAVSAFGTVGLSLNVTPTLTGGGKLVVVLLMFTGRVGLLTLLMMIRPEEVRPRIDYPGANVMVG